MHVTVKRDRITVVTASITMTDGCDIRTRFKFFPKTRNLLVEDRFGGFRHAGREEKTAFLNAARWAREDALGSAASALPVRTATGYEERVGPRVKARRLSKAVGLIESALA